nr:uncharacterized protein LOC109177490 [Ipomoea trifida]GMC95057.1 Enhancer of mRNA-decapping protein [Ipomoea batatas]GMC97092.1 Enhancer of mRNA-decapping protein [Ipomoea batatas]GMC99213.1 Enhancer of mRNA-decapping protein [Ipomoea batatas]
MPGTRHCPRIDTSELKLRIERKIGRQKTELYFHLLGRYLNLKLSKSEFDKLCINLLGRENICLHNGLIRAIIKNANVADTAPPKVEKVRPSLNIKVPNGYERGSLQSLCRDVFPQSPKKGRTPTLRDRKFKDRPSPLGPNGKTHTAIYEDSAPKVLEQQSATELLSLGSRPPVEVNSVEEGEEVEQAGRPAIYSRIPVTAPLGVSLNTRATRKVLHHGASSFLPPETCHSTGELPDSSTLRKRLEQKLEAEGLKISTDCANLLNNGLDSYLKRLLKPCLSLAAPKSRQKIVQQQALPTLNGMRAVRYIQKPSEYSHVSLLDFRVAMESNPRMLGEDWPLQLEKVCLRASEEP